MTQRLLTAAGIFLCVGLFTLPAFAAPTIEREFRFERSRLTLRAEVHADGSAPRQRLHQLIDQVFQRDAKGADLERRYDLVVAFECLHDMRQVKLSSLKIQR